MPRIEPITADQAPLLLRGLYANGQPGPIAATLAHVPEVALATLPCVAKVLGATSIPLRTKEIVILRTSVRLACRYCVQTHTVAALDGGLSLAEVQALRQDGPVGEAFADAAEQALIAWADAVAVGPGSPGDACFAAVRAHYGEAEVVELTLLVGATLMLNRFCTALDLPTAPAHLARLAQLGLGT